MVDAGNSLKSSSYKNDILKICRGLDCWMVINFHSLFKNLGPVLSIGTQKDGISCRVCALNALEHVLFDTCLFTHDCHIVLQIQYFTDIMKLLLDRVSVTYELRYGRLTLTSSQH